MRVFVSYSRGDARFVSRLVALLEGDGHDVWVDVDDIRGSEEWRASIVKGIRRSDVVVLVISPRSMGSEEVAREMAVAAQEERRIVPVVLEPAQLTDGIDYELAGVQQVSFVGRPFDEAAEDLRAALAAAEPEEGAALSSSAARATVGPTRSPSRRMLVAAGVVAVVIAAGAAFLVLRGGDGDSAEGATTSSSPAGATSQPGESAGGSGAGASSTALDAEVWFAGYQIAVHGASFDPGRQEASVDLTFTNVQPTTADPLAILGDTTVLEWDGKRATSFCACSRLAPGATLTETLTFAVDEGFDLAGAVLTFGQPRQHRALVPLDGSPPSGETPTTVPLSGVIDDGAGTTFTVERAEVLPARCSGLSSALSNVPGPDDEVSVVVWGTALTSQSPNVGFGQARLLQPDGTALASNSLDGVIYVLEAGQPQRDIPICFSVPAPASGEYRVLVSADGVEPAPPGLAFVLAG